MNATADPQTPNEQKTKRQHYVPQFVLRNFSADGVHIAMMLLPSEKMIPAAKIRTQCQDRYFYGEDQVVEKAFARDERGVARILGDLSVARLTSLTEPDLAKLVAFTYFQRAR